MPLLFKQGFAVLLFATVLDKTFISNQRKIQVCVSLAYGKIIGAIILITISSLMCVGRR